MQLGFVIDHSRCIGCHACTVACKSENDVPVDSFRTWVKYTESGAFPEVRRSFAVLRCNQCTSAPCVSICPVSALEKRDDGIVDVDPAACIGCKACMQGCPYDALYINENKGTAEKCHFCAHRVEQNLAPACAVVCPTEAIVPGDFHDPESVVSRMRRDHDLEARKTEAGTGPNVFYRDVAPAGIAPGLSNHSGGYLWAQSRQGPQLDAASFEEVERRAEARTVYDVDHPSRWGGLITGYLFFKSLAAGIFLAGAGLLLPGRLTEGAFGGELLVPLASLAFLAVTLLVLVVDLKRPERFLYIMLRPNWSSWLARGSFILAAYGLLLTVWLAGGAGLVSLPDPVVWALIPLTGGAAFLSAAYTGWLFEQAKGRVLWMKRGYWLHLAIQALLAGSAALLVLAPLAGLSEDSLGVFRDLLAAALVAHALAIVMEGKLAPAGRKAEYDRAHALVSRGPYARRHWIGGVTVGIAAPLLLLVLPIGPAGWAAAALLALIGLYVEEDVFVRAGQALPIS